MAPRSILTVWVSPSRVILRSSPSLSTSAVTLSPSMVNVRSSFISHSPLRRPFADAPRPIDCPWIGECPQSHLGIAAPPRGLQLYMQPKFSIPATNHTPQRGRLPCLRRGLSSVLSILVFNARINLLRVSDGSIISSMKPRAAAWYGFAKASSYSSMSLLRSSSGLPELAILFLCKS